MSKVRLLNGKPLMVDGKVALSDNCCCGAEVECPDCAIPETGYCPKIFCCSFNPTGSLIDDYWDNGEVMSLRVGASNILSFYPYFVNDAGTFAGVQIFVIGSITSGNDFIK